jgi:UDP-glucose 4-epimerase
MPLQDIKKKVLVTGGAGFIGSRLVHTLLERGVRVKVLDIQPGALKNEANPNLQFVGTQGDGLTNGMVDEELARQAVEDVDVIYHLAINWNGHTWKHELPLADLFDANVRGTLNLLQAAKSHDVRHFIFSSSCAVYGEPKTKIVNEETVCNPELWEGDVGPAYGILKLTAEKLCLLYHHQYGLPVTAFRIEFVFDDNDAIPTRSVVENLRKGGTIEVIESDGYGSVHVDEVVQALLLGTLNQKAYGQVFNLSNPDTYISYHELYQFLIKHTHSKIKVKLIRDPTHLGRAIESSEKIQSTLNWKPQKTKEDLKNAILRTVNLYGSI